MTSLASTSTISAIYLGETAWRAASAECEARVLGTTSRGVFLLTPPQQVVFVSLERYRSPLTINLDRSVDRLRALDSGAAARFSAARLIFPSIECSISLSEAMVWQCPPPAARPRSHAEQLTTLSAIAAGVLTQRSVTGLAALLPILLAWPDAPPGPEEQSALLDRLIRLRRAAQADDSLALQTGLTGLLGQGRGLTPSGDDVVIGLLLMSARSLRLKHRTAPAQWVQVSQTGRENMLKHVVASAYERTTTISANLIECAAGGQGDERLITVVDGIIAGSASIDECVAGVLAWGSSSGIDALVGMTIAVTAFSPRR
jgi:hypothetical protein